jgi:beta-ketoacyl-acyl-carrier-protein synthase II
MEKIVITGMGTVNPLGLNVADTWQNIINGVSGVAPITRFDASGWQAQIACEVKGFDPKNYMPMKEARRRDRFEQFGVVAAQEALQSSGLEVTPENAGRIGILVSSAMGGLESLQEAIYTLKDHGARRVSPFLIPMLMPNGAAGLIGIDNGIKGPAMSVASACASGIDGIGLAWMMLRTGMIDAALTGASESTLTETGIGAFDRIGALARRTDDYAMTPAPFDKNRDGLVMGEGAGILMLETESHAKARGANILAELAGYAATADAYHVTAPSSDGAGGASAISNALVSAAVNPDEVDYISAHGTATPLNDVTETRAIKRAFGEQAHKIPVSSTKSMTGHMMGATGALETIFCVKAIQENIVPPTIHYQTPDPECDLDYVPNQAREQKVKIAISNAFGFGGHNAVLVVKKYQ